MSKKLKDKEIDEIVEEKPAEEDIYSYNVGAANRLRKTNEPTIILDAEDNLEMLSKPVKEKFSIWKKREGAKLKDMHGIDKVKYIFVYYYQWMVVAAAVIFIIYVGCTIAYRKGFDTRLYIIAMNTEYDKPASDYLEAVIPEYFQFDKKDELFIEASMKLSADADDVVGGLKNEEETESQAETAAETAADGEPVFPENQTMASMSVNTDVAVNMKITAMAMANNIDIIIAEENLLTGYFLDAGIIFDISEYLDEDVYAMVEQDIVFAEDPDGNVVPAAIKMPEEFAKNLGLGYEPYVAIGGSTKNAHDAVNFIRLMYGEEYVPMPEDTEE